jgi:hypothetical protein
MDASIFRRTVRRPPLAPRTAATAGALVLLLAGHAVRADDTPARFDLRGSVQAAATTQANGGFELQARLTPSRQKAEGGGYSVDAVAAPAGTCAAGDVIFADGFE